VGPPKIVVGVAQRFAMVTHSQVDMFTRMADPDITDPSALREFRVDTQPPSVKPSMLAFAEHFDPPPKSASPPAGPPPTTFSPFATSPASARSAPPPTPVDAMFAHAAPGPSPAPSSVRFSPPAPAPAPSRSEIDRITSAYLAPSPARSMRSTAGKSFADMVDEIHVEAQQLQDRPTRLPPAPTAAAAVGSYAAPPNMAMAEYSERRELFIRIEDMTRMGFTFPEIPPNCATEDLRQEIDRREISMNTVDKVDTWIDRILKVTQVFHALNNKTKLIPLPEDYHSNMQLRVSRPQFRYNVYKIVLKKSRKSNTNPMMYIGWILAMPILEGIAIKLFTQVTGWDSPLVNGLLRKLIRSGDKKGAKKLPKVEGVTTRAGGGATVIPGDGFSSEAVAAFSGRTASAARGRKKLRPMATPAPAAQEPAAEGTEVVTAEELTSLPE